MGNKQISTEVLGRVTILNEQEEEVTLSTLWRKRTAALVFVRHFG